MDNNEAMTAFLAFEQLSPDARVAFLKDQPISTEQQAFMDGRQRVGSPHAVVVKHRAVVRGIRVGGWHDSPAAALADAHAFLEEFDGLL